MISNATPTTLAAYSGGTPAQITSATRDAAKMFNPVMASRNANAIRPNAPAALARLDVTSVRAKSTSFRIRLATLPMMSAIISPVVFGVAACVMPAPPAGGTAGGIIHDNQTEGYYIVSGGGTMFTDGYIVNGRHSLSPELNGPTCGGMAYDVVKKVVKAGDIIIVPAGVVHGWLDISDHVDYLSFRPSPGILTAGWLHPVLRP